jgi:hypothetical protein
LRNVARHRGHRTPVTRLLQDGASFGGTPQPRQAAAPGGVERGKASDELGGSPEMNFRLLVPVDVSKDNPDPKVQLRAVGPDIQRGLEGIESLVESFGEIQHPAPA